MGFANDNPVIPFILHWISFMVVLAIGQAEQISSLPKWQQVFINHTTWNGVYSYNQTSNHCRLGVHSVNGQIIASLVDRMSHFDMIGYSIADKVIFNKTTVYQSSATFDGSFQLSGILQWMNDRSYWSYKANVTVPIGKPFSTFVFYSTTDKSTALDEHTNTMSIVLGVVLTVAVLGIILMAGMMFYSYRKGLLRHVPLSYSTFKNSDNDQRASFDSRQQSVHI